MSKTCESIISISTKILKIYKKIKELPSNHKKRLNELSDDILNVQVIKYKIILKLKENSKY